MFCSWDGKSGRTYWLTKHADPNNHAVIHVFPSCQRGAVHLRLGLEGAMDSHECGVCERYGVQLDDPAIIQEAPGEWVDISGVRK
jgi:hypothetical protein